MSNQNNNQNEKVEKLVVKGLNFRLLVPQLTEAYKIRVCLGEEDPATTFQISEASNRYLTSLIKHDVKNKLPIEEKTNWLKTIKSQFSKFTNQF